LKLFYSAPTWALLFGAATWGILWYPYRLLAQAGLDGIWSTLFTYLIALGVGILAFPGVAWSLRRPPWHAVVMGQSIGRSNHA
jgi:hypothetical protein